MLVQHVVFMPHFFWRAAGCVVYIRMLCDYPLGQLFTPTTYREGWVRLLYGFWLVARFFQVVIFPLEVSLLLGPEQFEHFAGLVKLADALGGRRERDAVHIVFQLEPARAEAHVEPPVAHLVYGGGYLGEHGGVAVAVAAYHQAEAHTLGDRGQ